MVGSPVRSSLLQSHSFPGLLGLVYSYLDTLEVQPAEMIRIHEYLDLVKRRANGADVSVPL